MLGQVGGDDGELAAGGGGDGSQGLGNGVRAVVARVGDGDDEGLGGVEDVAADSSGDAREGLGCKGSANTGFPRLAAGKEDGMDGDGPVHAVGGNAVRAEAGSVGIGRGACRGRLRAAGGRRP